MCARGPVGSGWVRPMGQETGEQEHSGGRKGWGSRTQGDGQEESEQERNDTETMGSGTLHLLLSLLVDTALVLVEPSPPHNQSQHSIPSMEAKTVCHPSSHRDWVTGGRDGCGETSREAHTGPGTSVPGGGGWASLKEGKGRNRIQTSNRAGAH